jgi:hypothetical protein
MALEPGVVSTCLMVFQWFRSESESRFAPTNFRAFHISLACFVSIWETGPLSLGSNGVPKDPFVHKGLRMLRRDCKSTLNDARTDETVICSPLRRSLVG